MFLDRVISSMESVGRIKIFPFVPTPPTNQSFIIKKKTILSESEAEMEEATNHNARNFCLQFQQPSFHQIKNNRIMSGIGILLLTPSD